MAEFIPHQHTSTKYVNFELIILESRIIFQSSHFFKTVIILSDNVEFEQY